MALLGEGGAVGFAGYLSRASWLVSRAKGYVEFWSLALSVVRGSSYARVSVSQVKSPVQSER